MKFDTPFLLLVSPLVALVFGGLALWARRVRIARASNWSFELGAQARGHRVFVPLIVAIVTLLVLGALAGPRWGSRFVVAETKALNLVVAMDISRSMLAEDVGTSRLDHAKQEAKRLIHDLRSDRLGLIAFAGQSFIMSPVTADASALQLLVDALDPEIVSAGGTQLSLVLRQGRELLMARTEVADRVLVVFTDGEAHDSLSAVVLEAERLKRDGVHLVIVAQGRRESARIPVRNTSGELVEYYRDQNGNYVLTSRNDDVMSAVADAAHAAVVAAELPDQAGAIRDLVDGYKRTPQATTSAAQNVLRVWIPTLLALALLMFQTFRNPTGALVMLMLMLGIGSVANAQQPTNQADEAWRQNDIAAAARHYLAQVRAGEGGDTTLYNTGTAGMALGDTALGRQALERAAESLDPDIRFRSLYNLGLLRLKLAVIDSPNEEAHLEAARRAYRHALLLRPGDQSAKWNLELAIRRSPPSQSSSSPPPPGGQSEDRLQSEEQPSDLSVAQADQILNSAAEDERATRERLNRRRQTGESLRDKDW